jgi:hypothetical protein
MLSLAKESESSTLRFQTLVVEENAVMGMHCVSMEVYLMEPGNTYLS